jgi:hypothetical protein
MHAMQLAPEQKVVPGLQAFEQLPQCASLNQVVVSHPSSAVGNAGILQLAVLVLQLRVLHRPPAQVSGPLVEYELHARPHPPQFATEVLMLVSQPSA